MLRSFDEIHATASPERLLASGDGRAVLHGGGASAYRAPWHWHDCLMVLVPCQGALDMRDEVRRSGSWISVDRFVVVPKSKCHETRSVRDGHSHVAIYLSDSGLVRLESALGSLASLRRGHAPRMFGVTVAMRALLQASVGAIGNGRLSKASRSHVAAALLLECLSQIETTSPVSPASQDGHADFVVCEIAAFISANSTMRLPLDEIADKFGLSRRHATRLFREKTGRTIAAFQEQERLAAARRLLDETSLPVGEIAFRVGYDSGSALARAMRRVCGHAPSAVRSRVARSDN